MNHKNDVFHSKVLKKMSFQLEEVMNEVEHNSMVSSSTRQKALGEMQMQLDALRFAVMHLERAYGKAPDVIEGKPVNSAH